LFGLASVWRLRSQLTTLLVRLDSAWCSLRARKAHSTLHP
jgi:hypothetical protein